MWDQGSVFEWSVACRVEFTVRPGARTKPSCCSAADRVTGVSELHTNDAKHRTSKVQSVTKHMKSTLFLPDPIARMNVGDAQFLQAVDTFELCTSVGCNCTFSSFFFSILCCDDIAFMVWFQFWHENHLVSSWKRSCFGLNYLLWSPQIWKPFIDLTTAQNLLGFHFSKSGINGIKSDQRINGAHIPLWFSQLCVFSVFTK